MLVVPGLRIYYFKSENTIYIRYACVRMAIELFELFNASIKDNTPFAEGAIVRVYGNRVACARVSRRVTG